jgi:hypothetical protein
MPVNAIRLERLALLLVLVSVGLVFKLVVLMRALRSAPNELAAIAPIAAARASGGLSRTLRGPELYKARDPR